MDDDVGYRATGEEIGEDPPGAPVALQQSPRPGTGNVSTQVTHRGRGRGDPEDTIQGFPQPRRPILRQAGVEEGAPPRGGRALSERAGVRLVGENLIDLGVNNAAYDDCRLERAVRVEGDASDIAGVGGHSILASDDRGGPAFDVRERIAQMFGCQGGQVGGMSRRRQKGCERQTQVDKERSSVNLGTLR